MSALPSLTDLRTRIASASEQHRHMRQANALYRQGDRTGLAALGYSPDSRPFAVGAIVALHDRVLAVRSKLARFATLEARQRAAQSSPTGVAIEAWGGDVRVTFAKPPSRPILDDLKAARFWCCKGSWVGRAEQLPASVAALVLNRVTGAPKPTNHLRQQEKIMPSKTRKDVHILDPKFRIELALAILESANPEAAATLPDTDKPPLSDAHRDVFERLAFVNELLAGCTVQEERLFQRRLLHPTAA